MKAYQIGVNQYWTGATMEAEENSGIPMGWTRSVPPPLQHGEYAIWVGKWDITETIPPKRDLTRLQIPPSVIPMRNARLALSAAGLLPSVESYIQGMAGQEGEVARIEWQFAQTVQRSSPLVTKMTQALGKSESEIDALFIKALEYK